MKLLPSSLLICAIGWSCCCLTCTLHAAQDVLQILETGSGWTQLTNAIVHTGTGAKEALQKVQTFKWKNGKGMLVDVPYQCVYLEQEKYYWVSRATKLYSHFALFDNKLVGLSSGSLGMLFLQVSTNCIASKEELDAKLDESLRRILAHIPNDSPSTHAANLYEIVGRDAFTPDGSAVLQPPPKIKSVTVTDAGLTVKLEGANNGAIAEIIFDTQLNPTLAFLNGRKVFPK